MTKQEVLEKLKFDLELRNRCKDTIEDYSLHVRLFQDYFDKPADQMGTEEIKEFLHYLLTQKNNSPATVNTYNSALRFLYGETLDIVLNLKKIPRVKCNRKIPDIPTKEELGYIFYLTKNIKYKAIFMTIYGSGLRLSEAVNLKVSDIDGKQKRIFIRSGKGDRDRYALLPQKTLDILREYYKQHKPTDWLFVTEKGTQLTVRAVQDSFKAIVKKSDIPKHITIHTLRHCFATHCLNEGKNIFEIKRLLGHVRIDTTTWYLQLSDCDTLKLTSPLDTMKEGV
ncbi:MAG: site-specific integrase [Lachnospiraceae bacterium]|nr:site-specific integrase [Lachnospiraceae bacterium]